MTTSSKIRDAALDAYAGWNGWYHQWHWPDDSVEAVRKIQGEAVQAAADMRKKIDELRARIRKCEIVAGMAGDYLLDSGIDATIDEIRELAQQWAEATPEPEREVVANLLFAFHCEASAVKCRRSNDLAQARWYEAMAGHVVEGGPDPRNPVEPPCATCSGAGEEGGCPACGMVPW